MARRYEDYSIKDIMKIWKMKPEDMTKKQMYEMDNMIKRNEQNEKRYNGKMVNAMYEQMDEKNGWS